MAIRIDIICRQAWACFKECSYYNVSQIIFVFIIQKYRIRVESFQNFQSQSLCCGRPPLRSRRLSTTPTPQRRPGGRLLLMPSSYRGRFSASDSGTDQYCPQHNYGQQTFGYSLKSNVIKSSTIGRETKQSGPLRRSPCSPRRPSKTLLLFPPGQGDGRQGAHHPPPPAHCSPGLHSPDVGIRCLHADILLTSLCVFSSFCSLSNLTYLDSLTYFSCKKVYLYCCFQNIYIL